MVREKYINISNTYERSFSVLQDGLGTSGMFLSGLIMVTRNRFVIFYTSLIVASSILKNVSHRVIAWPTTLFGINQVITAHPLRNKEGGNGWTNLV